MKKKQNKSKLERAVDAVITRVESAEKFALDQAPDIAKEIIAEKSALAIYQIILYTAASAGFIKIAFFLASFADANSRAEWPYATSAGAGMAAFFFIILALVTISTLISVKTAPKLVILQELKSLLTKNS